MYSDQIQNDTFNVDTAKRFMQLSLENHFCCEYYMQRDSLNIYELELTKQQHKKKSNIYKAVITGLFSALIFAIK
tara:strand:- start:178 stop:402 length:225 start_codon:yes stop_codon:yes gene_type:complete